MTPIIGIDHIYITVSDMAHAEAFYTTVLGQVLGFRHNRFTLGGDPHVQFYNRHFGYVLRPARVASPHDPYSPGLHHFCFRVDTGADVVAAAQALQAAGIASMALLVGAGGDTLLVYAISLFEQIADGMSTVALFAVMVS